jgi:hypothetical protein
MGFPEMQFPVFVQQSHSSLLGGIGVLIGSLGFSRLPRKKGAGNLPESAGYAYFVKWMRCEASDERSREVGYCPPERGVRRGTKQIAILTK